MKITRLAVSHWNCLTVFYALTIPANQLLDIFFLLVKTPDLSDDIPTQEDGSREGSDVSYHPLSKFKKCSTPVAEDRLDDVSVHVHIWFWFTSQSDWSRKLAPLFQPIRCKTKTNHDSVTRVFPRFRQFG